MGEQTSLGIIQRLPEAAKWPLCLVVVKVRGYLLAKACDFCHPVPSCSGVEGTVKLLDLSKFGILLDKSC